MANFRDYTTERLVRSVKMPTYPTLNDPVLLFNRFRLYEIGMSLASVLMFGVINSNWIVAFLLVSFMLIGSPALRQRVPLSFLYRKFLDRFCTLPIGCFTWGRSRSSF